VNKLFAIVNQLQFPGRIGLFFLELFSNIGKLVISNVIFVAQYTSKMYAWVVAAREFRAKSSETFRPSSKS
jgi:hypothetical protein